MSAETELEPIAQAAVKYGKELGTELVAEVHVHGLGAALALFVGKYVHPTDPEEIWILLALTVLASTALLYLVRRRLRRAKLKARSVAPVIYYTQNF